MTPPRFVTVRKLLQNSLPFWGAGIVCLPLPCPFPCRQDSWVLWMMLAWRWLERHLSEARLSGFLGCISFIADQMTDSCNVRQENLLCSQFRGYYSTMSGRQNSVAVCVVVGSCGLFMTFQEAESRESQARPVITYKDLPSASQVLPLKASTCPNLIPLTGDRVFEYMGLWWTFAFKP